MMDSFESVLKAAAKLTGPRLPERVDVTPAFFAALKRAENFTATDAPEPRPLFGLTVIVSHDVKDPRGFEFRYADGTPVKYIA
jgi:hypothetical protein